MQVFTSRTQSPTEFYLPTATTQSVHPSDVSFIPRSIRSLQPTQSGGGTRSTQLTHTRIGGARAIAATPFPVHHHHQYQHSLDKSHTASSSKKSKRVGLNLSESDFRAIAAHAMQRSVVGEDTMKSLMWLRMNLHSDEHYPEELGSHLLNLIDPQTVIPLVNANEALEVLAENKLATKEEIMLSEEFDEIERLNMEPDSKHASEKFVPLHLLTTLCQKIFAFRDGSYNNTNATR